MTVEYKDGNRITALSTDTLPANPQDGMVVEFTDTGVIGFRYNNQWQIPSAWEFLGSKKLSVAGDLIEVSLSDDKIRDNYQLIYDTIDTGGTIRPFIEFNDLSTISYSMTTSANGVADTTSANRVNINPDTTIASNNYFTIMDISNIKNQEKILSWHSMRNATGASNAPDRFEGGGKFIEPELIKKFSIHNNETGNFAIDSEALVLGQSPNLTVPENRRFWKQIAFSEVRGTDDRIVASWEGDYDYLWFVLGTIGVGGTIGEKMRLNGDEGSSYANRRQINGTESTNVSHDHMITNGDTNEVTKLTSAIMVNKSTEEKLMIGEQNSGSTLGSDTAPIRCEFAIKHAQTTNRTNQVEIVNAGTGEFGEGSFILVFGGNALW